LIVFGAMFPTSAQRLHAEIPNLAPTLVAGCPWPNVGPDCGDDAGDGWANVTFTDKLDFGQRCPPDAAAAVEAGIYRGSSRSIQRALSFAINATSQLPNLLSMSERADWAVGERDVHGVRDHGEAVGRHLLRIEAVREEELVEVSAKLSHLSLEGDPAASYDRWVVS
jgi:hypothetical protein